MTNEEAKKAIVLNYGMLCYDLYMQVKESADFMHRFFDHNPDINYDGDLLEIAQEFQSLCAALKRLDKIVESKSGILK